MNYLIKSRMYREEVLKWLLITALFAWAITATAVAASTKNEVLLIGVSSDDSYLITPENNVHEKTELVAFIKKYLDLYYTFDEKSFGQNISSAGDLMSEELWASKQNEIEKLESNLKADPLSQKATIISLDQLDDGKYEVILQLVIHRKMDVAKVQVRVNLRTEKRTRSSQNVWPYQVVELTDAVL